MLVKQFDIWIADLNPQKGTEPGKTRPVVIVQSNMLNKINHPSTLICPITTNVEKASNILRVHIKRGVANMKNDCDVMIDQMRAIDNNRLISKIGELPSSIEEKIKENIAIVLELEK